MIKSYMDPSAIIKIHIKDACLLYMSTNNRLEFESRKENIALDFLKEMGIDNPTRTDIVEARSAIEFRAKKILDDLIAKKYSNLKASEEIINTMKKCDEIKENFRRSQDE